MLLRALPEELQDRHGHGLAAHGKPARHGASAYLEWRQNRFFELWRWTNQDLKINPNSPFIPNIGGADKLWT